MHNTRSKKPSSTPLTIGMALFGLGLSSAAFGGEDHDDLREDHNAFNFRCVAVTHDSIPEHFTVTHDFYEGTWFRGAIGGAKPTHLKEEWQGPRGSIRVLEVLKNSDDAKVLTHIEIRQGERIWDSSVLPNRDDYTAVLNYKVGLENGRISGVYGHYDCTRTY